MVPPLLGYQWCQSNRGLPQIPWKWQPQTLVPVLQGNAVKSVSQSTRCTLLCQVFAKRALNRKDPGWKSEMRHRPAEMRREERLRRR